MGLLTSPSPMPTRKAMKSKKKMLKKKKPMRMKKRKIAAKKKVTAKKKGKKAVGKKTNKKMVKKTAKKVTSKMIGRVTHYYDRIGVAIVELKQPLHLGDVVVMKHGEHVLTQSVQSLQIERQPVDMAKKGAIVGVKVDQEVKQGAIVMPA